MNIVRDYSEEYDALVERLMKQPNLPLTEESRRKSELFEEMVDAVVSQYVLEADLEFKKTIERWYFPFFDDYAELNGGRVEMRVDEDRGVTTIQLTVRELTVIVNDIDSDSHEWVQIIKHSEWLSVERKGE